MLFFASAGVSTTTDAIGHASSDNMREEDRAARARARNRIHARKSRQRKKMLVVNLRQGIEDLQVRAARGLSELARFSRLHFQAEIGHLLPWFSSHVNPDFKKWKEDHGIVAVPVRILCCDAAAVECGA